MQIYREHYRFGAINFYQSIRPDCLSVQAALASAIAFAVGAAMSPRFGCEYHLFADQKKINNQKR